MLFRNSEGKLIEIKRYDFKNDKLYYEKIFETVKNPKLTFYDGVTQQYNHK